MVDLSAEMAELWGSLGPPSGGRGRVVQLVAARKGEGVSTVARELAHYVATRAGRSAWLVDLDLLNSPQHAQIAAEAGRYGRLSDPVTASPNGAAFFTIRPPGRTAEGVQLPDARYLTAHRVGQARWWVTRFQRDALRGRQSVHILSSGDYWAALRKHADLIVVDCPPADRSQAAVTVAPFMDQTVLVVAADQADARPPAALRDAMIGAGGNVAGLFFNRAVVETPGFVKALLP